MSRVLQRAGLVLAAIAVVVRLAPDVAAQAVALYQGFVAGTASSQTGFLDLYSAGAVHRTRIQAADTPTAAVTWKMPAADAAGFLQSNGSGVLSASPSVGFSIVLNNDQLLNLGTTNSTAFNAIQWNTTQTVDTGMLLTGTTSNCWVVAERQDNGFDFAHAASTDPCIIVHSHNQNTNEWISMYHTGTRGVINNGNIGSNTFAIQLNGSDFLVVNTGGISTVGSTSTTELILNSQSGTRLTGESDGVFQLGADFNGATGSKTLKALDGITGSNIAGAILNLAAGNGTGNSVPGQLNLNTAPLNATSGTGVNTAVNRAGFGWTKVVTNNTVTTVANVTDASNTVAGVVLSYGVEVFNGTDLQVEEGKISCHVTNKAGTIANNTCIKYGNQQAPTSGTLTVTWTITAANPALLQVNANSSLTPSTGYPRVTYNVENVTNQALAIQ